ncbi:MAG: acyl-CoA dehydrogenase, partial [Candidatus Competibacteraceae bacterium]|nr:acyl-CoA dehydrogenase [Candidatus Competibacteraceae bacterium]
QAGSDLSAVRTRAVPEGDHYRLYGQKIYITWGDHDMTANTVHLVLARTPDAPEGVKGISLFLVPKYRLDEGGEPGERNDVHCVSIEHKLGINASPTCVMSLGDSDGAVGYLVGQENKGLAHMFTMMNEARLKVGLQGLAIADRAYQQARDYARDRSQGRPYGVKSGERVAIIHHPDVRRMLLSMRSQVEAMRGLCYQAAFHMDIAEHHGQAEVRRDHQARLDLLIPVIKGWCTELGVEIASTGIQVHGGMGYVEETGAAQHLRDARIAPIYEGTNGIQAIDLVGRKLAGDAGKAMEALIADIQATESQLSDLAGEELAAVRTSLKAGRQALQSATEWCLANLADDPNGVLAQAFNYMMLVGYVTGGWMMARSALLARDREEDFYRAKRITARFYAEQILPKAEALGRTVCSGGAATLGMDETFF